MGWLIAGAALSLAGGLFGKWRQRKEARRQARYQKAQAEAQAKAARENLSGQLVQAKESDYASAEDIMHEAYLGSRQANKQLHENQQASEENYMQFLEEGEVAEADLSASSALSGAEEDITLRNVLQTKIQRQMADARKNIDTQRDVGSWVNAEQLSTVLDKSDALRSKYDEGGSAMRSYYRTLENINAQRDLSVSYFNDVIKENTYNMNWFMSDVFDVGSTVLGTVGQAKSLGVLGKKPVKYENWNYTPGYRTGYTPY